VNIAHLVSTVTLVLSAAGLPDIAAQAEETRPRVIVSSDIGGSDPDDKQSFVHLLVYADVLQIEGLIASPPKNGRLKDIHEAIDAYQRDYPNLKTYSSAYPTPAYLRSVARQGETRAWSQGGGGSTDGSKWIIARAKAQDPRPLYILVFGSITDVAQAVKDDPTIKKKIRVYFIASWNRRQDPAAFDYLDEHHPDLWMIFSDSTFRGMYNGGEQSGDLGNRTFVEKHVRGHGALGEYFWKAKRDIKMGDTPSVLYLLHGDAGDPTTESWGGRYVRRKGRPNWWVDDPDQALRGPGNQAGAKTVSKWRAKYLRDWQRRMDRCLRPKR